VSHPNKLFISDFISQLPSKNPSYPTWYWGKGFDNHSLIVHNILLAINLISADMLGNSKDFIYFYHKINVYTRIDHVLCAEFDSASIKVILFSIM